jgi:hypothetical protein
VATNTRPSSSTSIVAPVDSVMLRIVLPPGPISAPIFSGLIDPRRERRQLRARLRHHFGHLVEDVQTALARLGERLAHNVVGDPGGLDVHL